MTISLIENSKFQSFCLPVCLNFAMLTPLGTILCAVYFYKILNVKWKCILLSHIVLCLLILISIALAFTVCGDKPCDFVLFPMMGYVLIGLFFGVLCVGFFMSEYIKWKYYEAQCILEAIKNRDEEEAAHQLTRA